MMRNKEYPRLLSLPLSSSLSFLLLPPSSLFLTIYRWRPDMTEAEAKKLLEDCLRVCFYRDCRSSSRILVAKATAEGTEIAEPYEVGTDWNVANFDKEHNVPAGIDGSSW